MNRRIRELLWVTGGLILATGIIGLSDADLRIARYLFDQNSGWPGIDHPFWQFLYHWAPVPAFTMAGFALAGLVVGFLKRSWRRKRRSMLFLLLVLVVGPGLLVNTLFKDQLGRPRPRELSEFGGQYQFSAPFVQGATGKNSSFPSGHASIAFYLLTPWFVLRERHRGVALGFLCSGLAFGLLVGMARIVQGAHFLSDILWAGGMIYLVAGILALAMGLDADGKKSPGA